MPGPVFATIAQSATASTPFALALSHRPVAILVPSLAPASEVRIQFASSSVGVDFADLARWDGTGAAFSLTSGAGPAWASVLPTTPWARVTVSQPQLDVRTVLGLVVNH